MDFSTHLTNILVSLPAESLIAVTVAMFAASVDITIKLFQNYKQKMIAANAVINNTNTSSSDMEVVLIQKAFEELTHTTNDLRKQHDNLLKKYDDLDSEVDKYRGKYYDQMEALANSFNERCSKCIVRAKLTEEIVDLKTRLKMLGESV